MPVYTYRREDGTTFEQKQSFNEEPLEFCPTTGQHVVRVIQPASIIFKGSGFYVNDSKGSKQSINGTSKNGAHESHESHESSNGNGNGNGSGPKAETHSEATSDAKSSSKVAAD